MLIFPLLAIKAKKTLERALFLYKERMETRVVVVVVFALFDNVKMQWYVSLVKKNGLVNTSLVSA